MVKWKWWHAIRFLKANQVKKRLSIAPKVWNSEPRKEALLLVRKIPWEPKRKMTIWYLLQIVEGILYREVMKFLVHEEDACVLLYWGTVFSSFHARVFLLPYCYCTYCCSFFNWFRAFSLCLASVSVIDGHGKCCSKSMTPILNLQRNTEKRVCPGPICAWLCSHLQ